MLSTLSLVAIGLASNALADVCPPGIEKTISVGSDGMFATVSAALASIPSGSATPTRVDISAGIYQEKLTIEERANVCVVGAGKDDTVLTWSDSHSTVNSTSGSASVHVSATNFSAFGLTFRNGFGSGSQAVALLADGERQQFRDCNFVGYQDTLYVKSGSQYFRSCYVQGNTDYVFGQARAVLQDCQARSVDKGSAVAAPNTDSSQPFGIVFLGGNFSYIPSKVGTGTTALGRPWGVAGAAAYLNVFLDAHISSAGFTDMSGHQPQDARFREYHSTGPGADASARMSYQMADEEAQTYTVSNVLGGWMPFYSL